MLKSLGKGRKKKSTTGKKKKNKNLKNQQRVLARFHLQLEFIFVSLPFLLLKLELAFL